MSKKKKNKTEENKREVIGLMAVGLDNDDGHSRITRSENFLVLGGSKETHEQMQDIAIRFDESLKNKGKTLNEAAVDEVIELLQRAAE